MSRTSIGLRNYGYGGSNFRLGHWNDGNSFRLNVRSPGYHYGGYDGGLGSRIGGGFPRMNSLLDSGYDPYPVNYGPQGACYAQPYHRPGYGEMSRGWWQGFKDTLSDIFGGIFGRRDEPEHVSYRQPVQYGQYINPNAPLIDKDTMEGLKVNHTEQFISKAQSYAGADGVLNPDEIRNLVNSNPNGQLNEILSKLAERGISLNVNDLADEMRVLASAGITQSANEGRTAYTIGEAREAQALLYSADTDRSGKIDRREAIAFLQTGQGPVNITPEMRAELQRMLQDPSHAPEASVAAVALLNRERDILDANLVNTNRR